MFMGSVTALPRGVRDSGGSGGGASTKYNTTPAGNAKALIRLQLKNYVLIMCMKTLLFL